MYPLTELPRVEETKDLMPNLSIFTKALFGDHSYLLYCQRGHLDWVTNQLKRADGFVWLPWLAQLWLVEVEWKKDSNFFEQSRAFARSKISWEKLSLELRKCLNDLEPILNKSTPDWKEGHLISQIINETKKKHYKDGYLMPHCWVVLGHDGENLDNLREAYEDEIKRRFTDDQQYVLTMTRIFRSDTETYALLTQYYSQRCSKFLQVEKTILVPTILGIHSEALPLPTSELQRIPINLRASDTQLLGEGRAGQIFRFLKKQNPQLEPDKVRLRIQLDQDHFHDFEISWGHTGKELMVLSKDGIQKKPADAAKEILGRGLPVKTGNIARRYGVFIDISGNQVRTIIPYADMEHHIWLTGKERFSTASQLQRGEIRQSCTYFDLIDIHKQTKIKENILNRKGLWEEFIAKKHINSAEFKQLSRFKPKAIAGFMHFLTYNNIASRFGDVFTLNDTAIDHIKKLLNI